MILAHRIRPNDSTRVPRRFVWLACEPRTIELAAAKIERFKSAVTAFDGWDARNKERKPCVWRNWQEDFLVWRYFDQCAVPNSRLVLTCHDLSYQLRLARAFDLLPQLGWKLQRLGMHDRSLTVSWQRADKATLVMVDAMSWLPHTLPKIDQLVRESMDQDTEELVHPADYGSPTWQVGMVRAAMLHLYDWVESDDLGNWAKTGATMAWNNWRHKHYTHKVIVHDDFFAQHAEEASTYAGRCEAWRWGDVKGGPFTEWDLPLAYARACQGKDLPVSYVGWVPGKGVADLDMTKPNRSILIKATVDQVRPALPVRTKEGIVWPVGLTTGWWWWGELQAAGDVLDVAEWHEAHVYVSAPALSQWADWVIAVAEDRTGTWSPVQRAAAKHWSRALIGRFATRYRNWQPMGGAPSDEITLMDCLDHDTGYQSEILLAGGEAFWSDCREYGRDTVPAVQSMVIAECRARLWYIMQVAGLDHVVYCDTDSVITDDWGSTNIWNALERDFMWGLRCIRTIKSLQIEGPRQLVADGIIRYAGIPRQATADLAGGLSGTRRESLKESLRESRAHEVVSRRTPWQSSGADHRRVHLPDGTTEARRLVP